MNFDRVRLAIGMDVVGLDMVLIGQITRIHSPQFFVGRKLQCELCLPFDAIADITGNQIVLIIPASQVAMLNQPMLKHSV